MDRVYGIIMAGGVGSRFWPMSNEQKPKQFLDVLGVGKSLLRITYERLLSRVDLSHVLIVTNEDYIGLVKAQIPELKDHQILAEPLRRNTAPCLAYATAYIMQQDPSALCIVSPADHLITDNTAFISTLDLALEEAKRDRLVTLGLTPRSPETGYGYIEKQPLTGKNKIFSVQRFCEKPSLEKAEEFLKAGTYLWNSGIFIWQISSIAKAFQRFQPDLFDRFFFNFNALASKDNCDALKLAFQASEDLSIDYAIMEKSDNLSVVEADFGWTDLGTWGSLGKELPQDVFGNAVLGKRVSLHHASDNIMVFPEYKQVLIDGLEGFIVVDTQDQLLILRKSHEAYLKNYLLQMSLNDSKPSE
jgi:mannose-1-phosphate guanylyltransferase